MPGRKTAAVGADTRRKPRRKPPPRRQARRGLQHPIREDATPPMPDPPRQRRVRRGILRSRQRLPRLPRRRSFRVPIRHAERLRRRRRSVRWCPAGSRFSSQPAKLVPGKRGTQRGSGDRIEAVLATHPWLRLGPIQADEHIPPLTVRVDVEHIPRFSARDHHAPFGVCARYLHGGIVPRLARTFNCVPASARRGDVTRTGCSG